MTNKKTQSEKCHDRYGMTNCPTLDVACKCVGCTGGLKYEGPNVGGTIAFLSCEVCGCTYAVNGHGQ